MMAIVTPIPGGVTLDFDGQIVAIDNTVAKDMTRQLNALYARQNAMAHAAAREAKLLEDKSAGE